MSEEVLPMNSESRLDFARHLGSDAVHSVIGSGAGRYLKFSWVLIRGTGSSGSSTYLRLKPVGKVPPHRLGWSPNVAGCLQV